MNTPKEALSHIQQLAPITFSQSALYHEAFATLTALVERDEAKKFVSKLIIHKIGYDQTFETTRYCCPSCYSKLNHDHMLPFCPYCGQRLDWSDK